MKLFAKKILLFLPILLVSYLLILLVMTITPLGKIVSNVKDNTGGHGQSLLRFREAQQTKNVDILFIGSSHASQGFDNRIFSKENISTFNMGSGLQTPQNSFYLLKQYVPIIKPKKIIMELYWDVLEYENGNEACIDITSNSPCSIDIIKMNLSTLNFKVINSMLANYISRIIIPLDSKKEGILEKEKYVLGGYLEIKHNEAYVKKIIQNLNVKKINIQKKQIYYLQKLIDYCKSQKIPLLFVTAPISIESIKSISNYSKLITQINNIVNENNTKWINFNDNEYRERMNLNTFDDFNDGAHLSNSGVRKFNNLLIDELMKINFIVK